MNPEITRAMHKAGSLPIPPCSGLIVISILFKEVYSWM